MFLVIRARPYGFNFPPPPVPLLGLEDYLSPASERSWFKDIPIEYLTHPDVMLIRREWGLRPRFRGGSTPDYQRPQSYTVKEYADRFALYPQDYAGGYYDRTLNDQRRRRGWPVRTREGTILFPGDVGYESAW